MSEVQTEANVSKTTNSVKCSICEKNYATVSILNRHIQEVHKIEERQIFEHDFDVYFNKCLSCRKSYKNLRDLREHLEQKHDLQQEVEEFTFGTKEEFEEWLEETCKAEKVQYILKRGTKKVHYEQGVSKLSVYYCNRSGVQIIRLPLENRKRATKVQGSRKLNYACTSQINVKGMNGSYCVTYYKTHYEHDRELIHLSISKSEKEEIAKKLLAGISADEILQEVRENAVDNDIQRINLLTRRDINNIRQEYKINEIATNETSEYEILECAENETLEYETFNEVIVETEEDDLKNNIRTEIEAISCKIEEGAVQKNALQDVYELLQAATALLNRNDVESDGQSQRIETYYLTVNVDED